MDKEVERAWEAFNKTIDQIDKDGVADPISETELVKLAIMTEICKRDVATRILLEKMMIALSVASLIGKRDEFLTMAKLAYQVGMGMIAPILCDKDNNEMSLKDLYEKDTEKGGDEDGEEDKAPGN